VRTSLISAIEETKPACVTAVESTTAVTARPR
jgi:hypothetical protein